MSSDFLKKPSVLLTLAAILALAGVVWGVTAHRSRKPSVPKEFTAEALKQEGDPGKAFEKAHQAMERTDLTDEQKHQIHENARSVMEARMDERMNEYFAAPKEQKTAILDRQIDEFMARSKEWEKRRAEREQQAGQAGGAKPSGSPSAGPGGTSGGAMAGGGPPGGGPNGRGPGGRGRDGGPPSRQERKTHSESRNPDQHARHMAYFSAMQSRATQRGIQLPFGPGHGR